MVNSSINLLSYTRKLLPIATATLAALGLALTLDAALGIHEKTLGPEHPSVGTSLNNLAGLYQSQGRSAEAEPLYQRALRTHEKALGPEHPSVGTSLNNLAGLYQSQGRNAEAEPLYRRALGIGRASGRDRLWSPGS